MARNENLRFGGHVDIQVSYKILRLDVLKKTPSLQNPPCFDLNRGCFEAVLMKNTLRTLGVNIFHFYLMEEEAMM
jgi:hypothetical protein